MKTLLKYLFLCLAVCGLGACGDGSDEPAIGGELVLSVDRNDITSGDEKAQFTVMLGEQDVTAECSIQSEETGVALENGVFIPDLSGSYTFFAEYKRKISNKETIKVKLPFERVFLKNVLFQQITSTTCPNCPANHEYVALLKELEPERMMMLGYHGSYQGPDPFMLSITQDLIPVLGTQGYGPVKIDYEMIINPNVTPEMIGEYFALKGMCGIALTTSLDGQKLTVNVKIKSRKYISSSCVLGVVVTENGLVAQQSVGSKEEPDYVHNDVVRAVLATETLLGDKIGVGSITPGKEFTKSYSYNVPTHYKKDKVEVIAYLIDTDNKRSLNCQAVKLGQSVDYQEVNYVEGGDNNPFKDVEI